MLDVSEDVRAEIGDEEADRLLTGENAPGSYDCTSCRTAGDTEQERTSTVLFVGDETAVLAFAHATCIPSQVVPVSEEQLQGAVRSITDAHQTRPTATTAPVPSPSPAPAPAGSPGQEPPGPGQAVIGVTSGLVLVGGEILPALVVEPTGPVVRPGSESVEDEFLTLLVEQGFRPVSDVEQPPAPLEGWSVLLAMGQLHAILQPGGGGAAPTAWWQAHQALPVTDGWRAAVGRTSRVLVFAGPVGSVGQQPREDLMREALDRAASRGLLVAATMPLSGT
nr:hypothetical protein [Streptomyces sp. TP-A0874]